MLVALSLVPNRLLHLVVYPPVFGFVASYSDAIGKRKEEECVNLIHLEKKFNEFFRLLDSIGECLFESRI